MKKTVAYYRNSSDYFQENSMNVQKERAKNYSIKHALPIDQVFEDGDTSAVKKVIDERKDFKRLIEEIKAGKIENVIVYKRDRLARKSVEYLEIYKLFKNHNVKIHFTSDNEFPVKYNNIGDFIEVIMSGMIEHEVKQMKERIAGSKFAQFEAGTYIGPLPFGYKKGSNNEDTKKKSPFIINVEEELEDVRRLYNAVLSRKHETLNELTKNIESIVTGKNKDKEWKVQTIKKTLSNPIYFGQRVMSFKQGRAERSTPSTKIIKRAEWEQVQEIVQQMERPRGKSKKRHFLYPLENLLFCLICEQDFVGNEGMHQGKKVGKYFCGCQKRGINKDEIEDIVFREAMQFFESSLNLNFNYYANRYLNEFETVRNKEIHSMEQEIDRIKDKIYNLTNSWMKTKLKGSYECDLIKLMKDKQQIEESMQELFNEKNDEKEKLIRLKKAAESGFSRLYFKRLQSADVKVLVNDIIDKVQIENKEVHFVFNHPFIDKKVVVDELK